VAKDFGEPQLTVRLEALGRDIVLQKGWSLDTSYLTPTDGFEFTLYDTDRAKLRGLELQPVNLLIDDHSQCLGRIDMTERGQDGTAITCRGRDYISDLTECHVDPTLQIKKEMTLETAILMGCGVCGIDTIISDDEIGMQQIRSGRRIKKKGKQPKRHKKKLNEYKPQPGESLFAFYNRIVARLGGTIQPGDARNKLVITAPRYDTDPIATITRLIAPAPAEQNLVLSATATRDFSSFPTFVLVSGKVVAVGTTRAPSYAKLTVYKGGVGVFRSPREGFEVPYAVLEDEQVTTLKQIDRKKSTTELAKVLNAELAEILGRSVVPGRRLPSATPSAPGPLYRLCYQKDAESGDQDQIDRVAVRAFAQKFKESLVYRVTVRGHVDPLTGAIWAVDTLSRIKDEVCEIDETMWCASRRFAFAEGQGATTEMEFWRMGSFVIDSDFDTV
jgi:prophage tail gpP-like protein